jgi:hypothetical protein
MTTKSTIKAGYAVHMREKINKYMVEDKDAGPSGLAV